MSPAYDTSDFTDEEHVKGASSAPMIAISTLIAIVLGAATIGGFAYFIKTAKDNHSNSSGNKEIQTAVTVNSASRTSPVVPAPGNDEVQNIQDAKASEVEENNPNGNDSEKDDSIVTGEGEKDVKTDSSENEQNKTGSEVVETGPSLAKKLGKSLLAGAAVAVAATAITKGISAYQNTLAPAEQVKAVAVEAPASEQPADISMPAQNQTTTGTAESEKLNSPAASTGSGWVNRGNALKALALEGAVEWASGKTGLFCGAKKAYEKVFKKQDSTCSGEDVQDPTFKFNWEDMQDPMATFSWEDVQTDTHERKLQQRNEQLQQRNERIENSYKECPLNGCPSYQKVRPANDGQNFSCRTCGSTMHTVQGPVPQDDSSSSSAKKEPEAETELSARWSRLCSRLETPRTPSPEAEHDRLASPESEFQSNDPNRAEFPEPFDAGFAPSSPQRAASEAESEPAPSESPPTPPPMTQAQLQQAESKRILDEKVRKMMFDD